MNKNTTKIINTFKQRANTYNTDGKWVNNIETIEPLVPQSFGNTRLLDICSGTGAIANVAHSKGWQVFALDITATMLQEITNNDIIKIVSSFEKLPFLDNYFDVITLRQGLQYSTNLDETILECKRVAKSQIKFGHITVFEKDDINWWTNYFKIASPGRKHIFKPNEIYKNCSKHNFNKVNQTVRIFKDSFINPLRYLNKKQINELFCLINNAPKHIIDNYQFKKLDNGDFSYLHRWEFITINC